MSFALKKKLFLFIYRFNIYLYKLIKKMRKNNQFQDILMPKSKIEKSQNEFIKIKYIFPDDLQLKSIFREVRTLRIIKNKSEYLIQVKDIQLNNNKEIKFIFSDEGIDLYSLINSKIFDYKAQKDLIKWILFQILKGVETLNSLNIIHRDLNPKNIFISHEGRIKIAGFSKSINDIESKFVDDKIVGELPYLAPELLIFKNFNSKIDVWSIGVIMLELYSKKTMLLIHNEDNSNENYSYRFFRQLKYLANFFKIPFNFNENDYTNEDLVSWLNNAKFDPKEFREKLKDIPDLKEEGLELMSYLLNFNPKERITAKEALKMPYFQSFQNFNKDEFKKKKIKGKNEDTTKFLKNFEKEYQKYEKFPQDKKAEILNQELIKIFNN